MKQVQLINVKTQEVNAFPIRKSVAEYIQSLNITDNSIKTIEGKLAKAINKDDVIYDTFKALEIMDEIKTEAVEEQPKKRVKGKTLITYKNGHEYNTFPSIKACATHFKELLELKSMPFTPIMKSVRQGVDWNEYSFKFENEDDLHIAKKKNDTVTKKNEDKNVEEQGA
ncbi:hypothetical protein [Fictibacillus sp. KU28468]|uniref:hypothetical protein n=1 Tax=Fictibacillus sp. KU28468 TaxID=2991053 RepID=UPI00223D59CE|nr:hypothetical protein [Fictibacillus sp. KU28468]UZJ79428.1 hypothetical protein OKX00_02775 [Fictibacillus sp. KU28468]